MIFVLDICISVLIISLSTQIAERQGTAMYYQQPGSALVCHDLPFHRLPHTATDGPKCFCIYRLKCSKAISGWMVGWLSDGTYSKSTCGAKNAFVDIEAILTGESRPIFINFHLYSSMLSTFIFYFFHLLSHIILHLIFPRSVHHLVTNEAVNFVFCLCDIYYD